MCGGPLVRQAGAGLRQFSPMRRRRSPLARRAGVGAHPAAGYRRVFLTKLSDLGPPIIGGRHGKEYSNERDHVHRCPLRPSG
ncbi:hypothetical protein MPLB_1870040 [Mesorhizobium sp. ORS 3324]|nr:hypothetical protein MPLB_1870040 [Mesorhizobium sp. ORS 3324]